MAPKALAVGICGPEDARRFYIVDQDRNYWNENEQTWTTNPKEAGLFAVVTAVTSKVHDLLLAEVPGVVQRFIFPVLVEVKTTEPITADALVKWFSVAVQVSFDATYGTGPGESMVMMRMDWHQLEETSEE